jgi:hypothetical protein
VLPKRKPINPFLTGYGWLGRPAFPSINTRRTSPPSLLTSNLYSLHFPASVANKRLTPRLRALDATLTKPPEGVGGRCRRLISPVTLYSEHSDLRAARRARRFCQVYRAAAVVWVCPEKYCSRPPIISVKPLWTLRLRAATTAGTFFPSTGSSCE